MLWKNKSNFHYKYVRIYVIQHFTYRVAQWIAYQTSDLGVAGSSPVAVILFLPPWNLAQASPFCPPENTARAQTGAACQLLALESEIIFYSYDEISCYY